MGDEPVDVPRRIFGLEDLRRCHVSGGPPCGKVRYTAQLAFSNLYGLPTNVIVRQVDFLISPAMFREISGNHHVALYEEELCTVEDDQQASCVRRSWLYTDDSYSIDDWRKGP